MTSIAPLGKDLLAVVESGPVGRILVSDSVMYGADRIGTRDVLVVASYSGVASFAHALRRGVRAIVGHDAGIGKDQAGVSGLAFAQAHGIAAAAVRAETAELGSGRSMAQGVISRCNEAARALGVHEGQNALDAARCLLAAPEGRVIDAAEAFDNSIHEVYRSARGAIYASTSSFVFKARTPDDVLCIASHAGRVFAESILALSPRAAIANDAGVGLAASGIAGLPILQDAGIAAAAVAAMSARIGDGLSTYRDGVISALNDLAHSRGVRPGMRASRAAELMLGGDR